MSGWASEPYDCGIGRAWVGDISISGNDKNHNESKEMNSVIDNQREILLSVQGKLCANRAVVFSEIPEPDP